MNRQVDILLGFMLLQLNIILADISFSIFSIKDIGMKVGEQVQDLRMGIVGCFREDGRSKPIWV